ncbi:MAG: hypothetical protein MUO91_03755 [candidate division Zixibacteria bacterium]|nr:hypothetical protein [candidate division Zixibacteria bacterium]
MGTVETLIGRLSISTILRYGYGGFLLVGLLALRDHVQVEAWIKATGTVVAPLIVFCVGACIYVVYRYVVGEFLFYPFMHSVHFLTDRLFYRDGQRTSPTGFLGQGGMCFSQRRQAYTAIRRGFFEPCMRETLNLAHSEIHILYLTAVEFAAATSLWWTDPSHKVVSWVFIVAAAVTFIAAVVTDINQHKMEYRLLRNLKDKVALTNFLSLTGYQFQWPNEE